MNSLPIPDEAIEAAAKGIWEARPMTRVYEEGSPNYGAAQPWDDIKQYQRDRCMTLARYALEAASPHMTSATYLDAAALVASEEQEQWRRAGNHLPGAQIVAQRMQVVGRILRSRATGSNPR